MHGLYSKNRKSRQIKQVQENNKTIYLKLEATWKMIGNIKFKVYLFARIYIHNVFNHNGNCKENALY